MTDRPKRPPEEDEGVVEAAAVAAEDVADALLNLDQAPDPTPRAPRTIKDQP